MERNIEDESIGLDNQLIEGCWMRVKLITLMILVEGVGESVIYQGTEHRRRTIFAEEKGHDVEDG